MVAEMHRNGKLVVPHQENGMVVFGIFVSGKGSLMSLSFENMSLGYLFLGWMSLALEGHL